MVPAASSTTPTTVEEQVEEAGGTAQQQLQQQQPARLHHAKPNCSYTCLIGMALKSTKREKMTVGDMYSYIRNRFPYYKTCPNDTWKNSVRHSLSLSRNFHRIGVKSGEVKMKKGLEWEVIPERREAVSREMELYRHNLSYSSGAGDDGLVSGDYERRLSSDDVNETSEHGTPAELHGHCRILMLPKSSAIPSSHQQGLTAAGVSGLPRLLHQQPIPASYSNQKAGDGGNGSSGGRSSQAVQCISIGQCRSIAKMLAHSGLRVKLRGSSSTCSDAPPSSTTISSQLCSYSASQRCSVTQCSSSRDANLPLQDTKRDQKLRFPTSSRSQPLAPGGLDAAIGNKKPFSSEAKDACNRQYFDQLLKGVDKAIASQYGSTTTNSSISDGDQSLTFAEISAALEKVEKRFLNRASTTTATVVVGAKVDRQHAKTDIKREGSASICRFCVANSKRARLSDSSVFGVSDSPSLASLRSDNTCDMAGEMSNSSLSLASNPSLITLGSRSGLGSKVIEGPKQQQQPLLLSKSEERMLLRDLERDAHKVSLNLVSYLRRAGEGIADCLRTPNLMLSST